MTYNAMVSEGREPVNMCEMIQKIKDTSEAKGRKEGRKEGFMEALLKLVKNGLLSPDDAAKQAGLSKAKFNKLLAQV
jgi:hypothetical protein